MEGLVSSLVKPRGQKPRLVQKGPTELTDFQTDVAGIVYIIH